MKKKGSELRERERETERETGESEIVREGEGWEWGESGLRESEGWESVSVGWASVCKSILLI